MQRTATLLCLLASSAFAAPGDLDPAFGAGGSVQFGFGGGNDYAKAVAIQSDGKIVVAGSASPDGQKTAYAVARTDTDGTLDTSFNSSGKAFVSIGVGGDIPAAMVLDGSGKIVVAGYSYSQANHPGYDPTNFSVARLNSDGSLDVGFGSEGKLVIPEFVAHSTGNRAYAMALDGNGKIVMAGYAVYYDSFGGPWSAVAVVRINPDGSLDTTFGTSGQVTLTDTDGFYPQTIAIDSGGRVVLAGPARDPANRAKTYYGLMRLTSNGAVDTGFGNGGAVVLAVGPVASNVTSVKIDAVGRIVASGYSDSSTNGNVSGSYFSAIRLNSDGTLDTNFGTGGGVMVSVGTNPEDNAFSYALSIDANGKVVIAGYNSSHLTLRHTIALVRLNYDGTPDASFGSNGRLSFAAATGDADVNALVIDSSGSLVVAGNIYNSFGSDDFLIARFSPSGGADASFGAAGVVALDIGNGSSQVNAIVQQGDGRLVLAGHCDCGSTGAATVARLGSTGAMDASFGNNGKQVVSFGANRSIGKAVAVQGDAKVVIAGTYYSSGTMNDFAIARLNADGTLDGNFGASGKLVIDVGGNDDQASAVGIDGNGGILVAGTSQIVLPDGSSPVRLSLIRLNPSGTLDTGFGTSGKLITSIGSNGYLVGLLAMARDAAGRIVLLYSGEHLTVVRLNADGSLDTAFGIGGSVAVGNAGIGALALDAGGRIIVGGSETNVPNYTVTRLYSDGSPDLGFGTNGHVTAAVTTGLLAMVSSVAVDQNGKIVVAGSSLNGSNTVFTALRFNSDGSLDTGFGISGEKQVQPGAGNFFGYAMLLDSSNGIIVAGQSAGSSTPIPGDNNQANGEVEVVRLLSGGTGSEVTALNLFPGWNLVGNGNGAALDVATAFGNSANVVTVWKWVAGTSRWAFYAPSLVGGDLIDYAAKKGYDILTTITGGEGFWLKAIQPFSVQMPSGTTVVAVDFLSNGGKAMVQGWNLISIGETMTPSQFNGALSGVAPKPGTVPNNVTTLWAWDSGKSVWYFYAASLQAQGGTKLTDYVTSRAYLDFTFNGKSLGQGVGFWVNRP